MSENLNRRSAWGALAGLPALAILPGAGSALASTAPLVHPDAALFAMKSAIETADRELDAALDALEAAADAYSNKEPAAPSDPGFSAEEQQALDAFAAKLRAGRERGPPPEWVAYEQAIQDYEREVERQKAECGVTAADELEDVVHETISQVRADLVDTPARTLAGVIFKARCAGACYRTEYDEEVMASIVDDLLAMADDGPEGPADVSPRAETFRFADRPPGDSAAGSFRTKDRRGTQAPNTRRQIVGLLT